MPYWVQASGESRSWALPTGADGIHLLDLINILRLSKIFVGSSTGMWLAVGAEGGDPEEWQGRKSHPTLF